MEKSPLASIEEVVVMLPVSAVCDLLLTSHFRKDNPEVFGVLTICKNPDDFLRDFFCEILRFFSHSRLLVKLPIFYYTTLYE